MIYLDHAATTPLADSVLPAMLPWMGQDAGFANPASSHAPGRAARAAVERARQQVASLIGAQPAEIIWTSGATESNNLAIKGALEFSALKDAHVLSSRTEHRCVLDTCRWLETRGTRVSYLKPNADGRITVEQVMAALRPETALVSLMWVNNETGAMNYIAAIAPVLRERGIALHVDAAQAVGKIEVGLSQIPIDLLSISAHKLGGPKGVGALFVRKKPRARLAPQMHGGGHEWGMRSGTLATHQIVGLGAACDRLHGRVASLAQALSALRERMYKALGELPDVHRNGAQTHVAPHILNLSFEGVDGESLRAGLCDLAVSSGSACSSATAEPSYVLRALGRSDALADASLRFSFGENTSEADIDQAAQRVFEEVRFLRAIAQGKASVSPGALSNVLDYPAPVWRRFRNPDRIGAIESSMVGRICATVDDFSGHGQLSIELVSVQGQVQSAVFSALGCPTTIAVGQWICEQIAWQPTSVLSQIKAQAIAKALEIGESRLQCALMGEDVVKRLNEQLRES